MIKKFISSIIMILLILPHFSVAASYINNSQYIKETEVEVVEEKSNLHSNNR